MCTQQSPEAALGYGVTLIKPTSCFLKTAFNIACPAAHGGIVFFLILLVGRGVQLGPLGTAATSPG